MGRGMAACRAHEGFFVTQNLCKFCDYCFWVGLVTRLEFEMEFFGRDWSYVIG
jgi:hypothetical protein